MHSGFRELCQDN